MVPREMERVEALDSGCSKKKIEITGAVGFVAKVTLIVRQIFLFIICIKYYCYNILNMFVPILNAKLEIKEALVTRKKKHVRLIISFSFSVLSHFYQY